jgi:NAD dependent epimerase/dehydratase family enzyme
VKILFLGGTGFFGMSFKNFIKNENEINLTIDYVGRSNKSFFKDSFIDYKNINKIKKKQYSHLIHCAHASTNKKNITEANRFKSAIDTTKKIIKFK